MKNTQPKWRRARRLGFSLLGTGEELKKRSYAPGQHGQGRKKQSQYGKQLTEKQKLRDMYGVNERQFRRLYLKAREGEGVTGDVFFRILESRLDNLVYRIGFATTRAQARQLVNHGHILVNGKKIDIPSYICNVNDVISLKESSKDLTVVKAAIEATPATPAYVSRDDEKKSGTYLRFPERNELPAEIHEAEIIEYYNRIL